MHKMHLPKTTGHFSLKTVASVSILVRSPQIVNRGRRFGARGSVFHVGPRRSRGRYGKKRTQVPQKSAKVDILPISIYLVVVLYRHKHCRPQKVELDLACRDSTTTNKVSCFICQNVAKLQQKVFLIIVNVQSLASVITE
jgi:hypothetical protein